MTEQFQSGWNARTPCGMYYTYETNKATGREVLVKHYAYNDLPAYTSGNRTFREFLDNLINMDTCDGYYDWQPMIARLREHIAKIEKKD